MDRDEIERRDFPAARRGYDAAAVHEHLRRVADEFEALAARPHRASVAEGTSTQVRAILEAAESSAQQLRDDAGREASDHVERVGDAAKDLLGTIDRLQGELDRLMGALRSSAESLTGSLEELSREVGTLRPPVEDDPVEPAAAEPPAADAEPPAPARRQRRALGRRGRRAARRAQHGARGRPARGDRPLPRRALRARRRRETARRRLCERRPVTAAPPELAALHERAAILADLGHIHSLLFWDQNTMMPPDGAPARGDQAATLEAVAHERLDRPRDGPAARRARALGRAAGPRRRRRPPRARAAARLREGGARPDQPGRGDQPRRRARPGGVAGGARRGGLLPLPRRARAPDRAAPPLRRLLHGLRPPLRRAARRLRAEHDDRGAAAAVRRAVRGPGAARRGRGIRRAEARAACSAARTRSRTSAAR